MKALAWFCGSVIFAAIVFVIKITYRAGNQLLDDKYSEETNP